MEKYSRWRDPSTGVAPFLPPLAASTDRLAPLVASIALPIQAILGSARTLVVVLLLGAHSLIVHGLLVPFSLHSPTYAVLSRAASASIARLILVVIGFLHISVETVLLRKTGRSPPAAPFEPKQGDLIVANSSSYLDLVYLAFRHNASFVVTVSNASNEIIGFRRVSLVRAVLASANGPRRIDKTASTTDARLETLDEVVRKSPGPVALFPEATTSNNRALLRFAEFAPSALVADKTGDATTATSKTNTSKRKGKVYVLAFRYPAPTRFSPSPTYPIPTEPSWTGVLSHLYLLTSRPCAYSLSIRRLHPSEPFPSSSSNTGSITTSSSLNGGPVVHVEDLSVRGSTGSKTMTKGVWDGVAETLATVGRLKRVGGLGWVEKEQFVEFRRVKGR